MVASQTGGRRIGVWIVAAIGAVALHSGVVALALAVLAPEDAPDDLGSNAIDVDYVQMAPKSEPTNMPAGPDSEASAASPASEEQKETVKETSLPQAPASDTEDPDRTVVPDKNPVEKQDKTPNTPAPASSPTVPTEATANPASETATAAIRSVAPELGTGDSMRRVRSTWQKELAVHLNKYKRYPSDRTHQAAEIVISFQLDRVGHVLSASVTKSSGDASFDDAALAMMKRSDPVPAPPPLVADEGLTFTMPVVFRAKSRN